MKTTALVTGAAGLIGSHLVRVLLDAGVHVKAFVRATTDTAPLNGLPVELFRGDVECDTDALCAAALRCDFLFHTAMHYTYSSPKNDVERSALRATRNVMSAARSARVRRVVVTSSAVVFGFSLHAASRDETAPLAEGVGEAPYIRAKIKQDQYTLQLGQEFDVDVTMVCPTVTVGPLSTNLGASHALILAYLNDPFRSTYPGGCNIASAHDVAYAHWLVARDGARNQHYLAGGENVEWQTLHTSIAELAGIDTPRFKLNHISTYIGASVEEVRAKLTGRPALSTRHEAAMIGRYYWYEHGKIARLGYQPVVARAALAHALAWLTTSSHMSRETRATLRLTPEVYAARKTFRISEEGMRV